MQLTTIYPEIRQAFAPLIPAGMQQMLTDRPEMLAIGAVDGQKPCGVLLATLETQMLRVLWLYTAEEMRGRGVARSLIRLLVGRALQDPDTDRLVADVPDDAAGRAAFSLLLSEGWNPIRFSMRDFSCTLEELAKQPFWQRRMRLDGICLLSKVPAGLIREYSAWLSTEAAFAAVDLPLQLERYNQSLSLGYVSDGRLKAILLAGGTEEELVLEYAQSQVSAAQGFGKLVYAAGRRAIDTYSPKTRVSLAAVTPAAERLAEKLMPNASLRAMYRMVYNVRINLR